LPKHYLIAWKCILCYLMLSLFYLLRKLWNQRCLLHFYFRLGVSNIHKRLTYIWANFSFNTLIFFLKPFFQSILSIGCFYLIYILHTFASNLLLLFVYYNTNLVQIIIHRFSNYHCIFFKMFSAAVFQVCNISFLKSYFMANLLFMSTLLYYLTVCTSFLTPNIFRIFNIILF